MMTTEEFGKIVVVLNHAYYQHAFLSDEFTLRLWRQETKDMDYNIAAIATRICVRTEPMPPSISKFVSVYAGLTAPEEINDAEAMRMLDRAIRNGIYGYEKEYAQLPHALQRALGDPYKIRELAVMDIEQYQTCERARVLKVYQAEKQREKEERQLSPELIEKINAARLLIKTDGAEATEKLLAEG